MPYISKELRACYDEMLRFGDALTPGELNYIITKIVLSQVKKPSYTKYNELIGVLECVKQELYRRAVASYEDRKKEENGDVFEGVD
jgi:hypothetical protein